MIDPDFGIGVCLKVSMSFPNSTPASSSIPIYPNDVWQRYVPTKDLVTHTLSIATPPSPVDLVILTITDKEFKAVFQRLEPLLNQDKILAADIADNKVFCLIGRYGPYTAALVKGRKAGMATVMKYLSEAIQYFKPKLAINVGIAWGARQGDQRLGEVLVANSVVNPDDVKKAPTRTISRSLIPGMQDRLGNMVEKARLYWRYPYLDGSHSHVHVGLCAGSYTLLNNSEARADLIDSVPDLIGGEMESFAIYEIANWSEIPWLVIKGISDWGDGDKNDQYHHVATASAADFLHFMCTGYPLTRTAVGSDTDEKKTPERS